MVVCVRERAMSRYIFNTQTETQRPLYKQCLGPEVLQTWKSWRYGHNCKFMAAEHC